MKRKIFSILLTVALVLSLGLITAVPAAANGTTYNVVPYTLQTGDNAASWSTVQKATGSSSVLLNYVSGDNSYVEFTPATGTTVNDLATISDGWSWWYYASAAYGPLLELRFTGGSGGHVDITVDTAEVSPAITTGTTEEVTSASTCIYYGNDDIDQTPFSNVTGSVTLAGVLASINAETEMSGDDATTWELTRVRAEIGWSAPARTCYIDDIEIADVTYYGSIQDAIDVAVAGDTITVAAGTYVEEITVDKNLTITCTATCTITGDVHFDAASITMTDATLDTGYEWYIDSDTASIQDAIDAATASDTINVAAGTYVEDVTVGKNLTLKSVAGRDTTTIQGTLLLNGSADNFTLGGTTGKGFTIEGTDPLICLMTGADTVEISHNALDTTTGSFSRAITTNPGNVTGLTVSNNTFTLTDAADQAIRSSVGDTITGWTISDNDFTGTYPTKADQSAIEIPELNIETLDTTISGNTFTTVNNGVLIGASSGGGLISHGTVYKTLTITDNTFTGGKFGIDLTNASSADHVHDVRITQNTFTNNTEGLAINHGDYPNGTDLWQPEDFTVKYNQFSGNTHGIYNNADVKDPDLTAEYNYWGRATGAYHATTNPGVSGYRGDAVSDDVDYDPWLYYTTATNLGDTLANIVANQVPAYAFSRPLLADWNTFSVPIGLDGQYNNWDELITLTNLDYSFAYRFNSTTQQFVSLSTTDTYAMAPGEGFYIKMDSAGSIPYCFSTLFSMPSRALGDGWNMIGGGMEVRTEEDSCISIATAGGTAGYSHIVSPLENAESWVFIAGAGTAKSFAVGEGYWVFLPIDRTLGLFDPTPLGWVP